MENYQGPFIDPSQYMGNDNYCDPQWLQESIKTFEGTINGPAYTWDLSRWLGYNMLCPETSLKVLDHISVGHDHNANGRMQDWRDPNVVPPVPPSYTTGGTGAPIQRGTDLPGDVIYYHGDKFGDNNYTIIIPERVEWVRIFGYWYWYGTAIHVSVTFFTIAEPIDNICPPGTVFNPVTGTCDVLPGYSWNSGCNSYISNNCVTLSHYDTESFGVSLHHTASRIECDDGTTALATRANLKIYVEDNSYQLEQGICENDNTSDNPSTDKAVIEKFIIINPFTNTSFEMDVVQNDETNIIYATVPLYKNPDDDLESKVNITYIFKAVDRPTPTLNIHTEMLPTLNIFGCNSIDHEYSFGGGESAVCDKGTCCNFFSRTYTLWEENEYRQCVDFFDGYPARYKFDAIEEDTW